MRASSRVLLGAGSNWLRFLTAAAVSFLLVPLMTRSLGAERYGLWVLVSSALAFLQALDAGFGSGTVKWAAERGDPARRDALLTASLLVHLAAGALGSVLVLLGAFFLAGAAGGGLAPEARALILLAGLRVTAVGLPAGFFRGLLFGRERLLLLNFVQALSSVAWGLAAAFLLGRGAGPAALAAAGLGLALLELLALAFAALGAARAAEPPIRPSPLPLPKGVLAEAWSFSSASFAVQASAAVLMQSDLVVLRLAAPLGSLAVYGVAQRAAEYGFLAAKQAASALTPAVARADPRAEPEKARFMVANASKYSGGLGAVFAVGAAVLGAPLLEAWAGEGYGAGAGILLVLSASFLLVSVQLPSAAFLSLKGRHVFAARSMAASAAANLGLSLALAPFLGAIGVALGTLASSLVFDGLVLPLRAFRELGMGPAELLRRVWLRLLAPAAAEALVLFAGLRLLAPEGLAELFGLGLAGTAAFALVFWAFSMDASERGLFLARKRGRA